jgi:N-acetylmuramoyl-L-alanine amidase
MIRKLCVVLIFISGFLQNSVAQTDTIFLKAESGDGIIKLLKRHNLEPDVYIDTFKEQNSDKLKDNQHLILNETYMLVIETQIVDSICNELEIIEDSLLAGAVIYIIAGHGGPDPGAITIVDGHTISEDEYAYDICMRLKQEIIKHSGEAIMIIRDSNDSIRNDRILEIDNDEFCYPDLEIPYNHTKRLVQRADAVNDLYANKPPDSYQRVVVIHLDSRSTGQKVDVFFYHFPGSKKGKAFADNLKDVFADKYAEHQPNRGYEGTVSGRNLLVLRKTLPPATFVELANIKNLHNQKRFLDPDNRQALAKWLCEGIIRDFNSQ